MNVVGEAVSDYVSEQIKVRQKTYGSTNASTRPLADTLFLNQRIAFARLVSGVDIDDPSKLKGDIKNIITSNNLTSNKLASKFILFAGTSERDTKNSSNLLAEGFVRDGSSINRGAYGLGGLDFGLKPMPGITSVDIKSENRGSLRTANIKIKAWNTTQFDIIDLLYLRLGYSVLFEWGNVSYIDNGGNPQTINQYSLVDPFLSGGPFQGEKTPPPSSPSPFRPGSVIKGEIVNPSLPTPVEGTVTSNSQGEATITALLDNIALLRKQSAGNYDAFYGKVINFDWNLGEDGSYDINLELRSVGDVVESLRMNVLINDQTTEEEQQEEETGEEPTIEYYKDKNQFGRFFYECTQFLQKNGEFAQLSEIKARKGVDGSSAAFRTQAKYYKNRNQTPVLINQRFSGLAGNYFYPEGILEGRDIFSYIRFGNLLSFIQNSVLPVYKNGNSQNPLIYIDYNTDTNLAYFNPFQISADPRICVINTTLNGTYDNNPQTFYYGAGGDPYVIDIGGIKVGQIMNIYVNMLHVLQLIDNNATDEGISLIDLLTQLCSDISSALGGVNNFEPFIEEETNTIKIIDQTPLSGKDLILPKLGKKLPKDTTPINLYGYKLTENPETKGRSFLGNFVRNYGIKTELTNAFATTVTIGAQARGSVVGENSTALSKLNEGLIDRIKPEINDNPLKNVSLENIIFKIKDSAGNYLDPYSQLPSEIDAKLAELEQRFPNALKDYSKFAYNLSNTSNKPLPYYDDTEIDNYTTVLSNFLKYLEAKAAITNSQSSGTEGFLPVSIELTLDGLSGIKIYNGLNVDTTFLPSNYPETMDFLVTSLNHKIENNIWTTNLGTVMVPNNTVQAGGSFQEGSLRVGYDVNSNPIDIPNRALDPAPKINPNRIGATSYSNSPLAQNLSNRGYKNAYLPNNILVNIGFAKGGQNRKLHPSAASALRSWITELEGSKIPYRISSAYRDYKQQANLTSNQKNAASAGSSPHGWGGAVDFGNFYQRVGGSTDPITNLNARVAATTDSYSLIAQIGSKYGWYNPWRLSDNRGVDEIWHFEYWGPVNS